MSNSLTVEIVNDSEQDDDNVYLLLTGATVSCATTPTPPATLQLPQASGGSVTASALNAMSSSTTLTSPLTGKTRNIYNFDVTAISSGRLLVSFGTPITYADNTAPTAQELPFRWDKMEFGYPASGADLTSLDFFGIPLQFDYLDTNGNVLASRTFYSSTATLLAELSGLSSAMSGAFQPTTIPPVLYDPAAPGGGVPSTFLRVLGPQTVAASSPTGSPAPYPSFAGYLAALTKTGDTFSVSGAAGVGAPAPQPNTVNYAYSGSFTSDGNGGYTLTLTGTTSGSPYGLYTNASNVTSAQQLPPNLTVVLSLPADQLDINIYGAGAAAFSVEVPPGPPPAWLPYVANSVYATIAGDILAGLHFGYPDGVWGNAGSGWYSNPPTPYPFAAARASNDGYYNPYAAVFYNLSGAYGFPFSDRGGRPSPYVPQPADATTLRITVLPDFRLDQPLLSVVNSVAGELDLTWPTPTPPAGFTVTGYQVTVSPVVQTGGGLSQTVNIAAPATGTTVTGLLQGMDYTVSLTVLGTGPTGGAVTSYPATISANSGGTATVLDGSYTFLITMNWSSGAPMPTGTAITIAGSACVPQGAPATINGSAGVNLLPLVVTDGSGTVIYQDTYVVELAASTTIQGDYILVGQPLLLGNSQPLVVASTGPNYSGTAPSQLVIGTPFAPVAGKLAAPVVLPA